MLESGRMKKYLATLAFPAALGLACTGEAMEPIAGGKTPAGQTPGGGGGSTPGGGGSNPGGGGSTPGGGGSNPGGGGVTMQPPAVPGQPGAAIFRRMTRLEINNTVRDLLGDNSNPGNLFPPDQESQKSGFMTGSSISPNEASKLWDASEAIATRAMARVAELVPCKPIPAGAAEQDACAGEFITQFGKRAFRRPLSTEEAGKIKELYAKVRSGGADFPNSIRTVIAGFLLSPQFIYRWETTPKAIVKEGNLVRFNSYEVASRLSYLIWASMPDDELFKLADENKLQSPEQIEGAAKRMLGDGKAKAAMGEFFTQWLKVNHLHSFTKEMKVYPTYSKELADSMLAETSAFAASSIIEGDGKLSTVFTSNKGFVDAKLATLYGVTGVTSATPSAVDLNPAQRGGVLTQAAFLATHASPEESNPPRRGKIMIDRVICIDVPNPPDNVPDPEEASPSKSVRERFETHSKNPCASACHNILDPLGFAFEHYNGIGGYQAQDGGKPVNASGTINLDGKDVAFTNALELGRALGASKQVGECMNRQFLRYALRRREDVGDNTSLTESLNAFSKDASLRDMLVAFTKTRSFTHRTPSIGESLQ